MKRDSHSSSDFAKDLEKDPVWDLLRESRSARPSPNFADNVVRAARLKGQEKPWWSRIWIPAAIGTSLAGAAALVAVVVTLQSQPGTGSAHENSIVQVTAPDTSLAGLQDDFENEVFLEASDHLGKYDDAELVSMIGF
ncbi:hypothetical protein OKA04_16890 [Luteolibacter flavescens]|uniref:Anti sigma-E protein RseA N-terminal domain-containing protein n=1 Tax=Luteolibacter flavescens TaxID=1859460 RepID=A0ABT3FSJ9_9BACT|nr:hypothetical protein [Luteolibacter flavescens]MCW1886417.1 hypothetical protein [Luteolibacter flavescens]